MLNVLPETLGSTKTTRGEDMTYKGESDCKVVVKVFSSVKEITEDNILQMMEDDTSDVKDIKQMLVSGERIAVTVIYK